MNDNLHFTDDDKEFLWKLGFNTSNPDDGPFKYTRNGLSIFISKYENEFIAHAHDVEDIIEARVIGEDASQVVKDVINQWHEKFLQVSTLDATVQNMLEEISQFDQEKMTQHVEEEMREQEEAMMQEQQMMAMDEQQLEDGVLS